ncbi:MAG: LexA family protein [Oscillospiraceae bacterium]
MFYERIQELCRQKGIPVTRLVESLGLSKGNLYKWRTGAVPKADTLKALADYFGVTMEALLQEEPAPGLLQRLGGVSLTDFPLIAILGSVKAGYGCIANEEIIGYETASVKNPEECFYLLVKGDSMEPYIHDGDLALVRKQEDVDSGELAVVLLDGEEGTLKKVVKQEGTLILQPFNRDYTPQVYTGETLNRVRIVGRVLSTVTRHSW